MPLTKLVWITPDAERHIAYCARVSNPANQGNSGTAPKLISYLIKHKHWSPFEMAHACFEVQTSRAISAQILRHRSFSFQEFSQRYSEVQSFETYPARRQDIKNRQNSIDDLDDVTRAWFTRAQYDIQDMAHHKYNMAIEKGIAKEQARMLLPLSTSTRLYMAGSIRSWIHYIDVRTDPGTQLEHRQLALEIRDRLTEELPALSEALGWKESTSNEPS